MWLLFSGIGILVYSGLCAYIGLRLFEFFRFFLPGTKAFIFWLVFVLVCYGFVLTNLFRWNRLNFLRHLSAYWMAVFIYLLASLILFDLIKLALLIFNKSILTPQFTAIGVGAALCLCLLTIIYGAVNARTINTVNYRLDIPVPDEKMHRRMRIAHISDLHIGSAVDKAWVAKVVNKINSAEPDMVCITGDIFDGNLGKVQDLDGVAAEFRRIKAPQGVYACLGNHDVDRQMSLDSGTESIEKFLSQANITLLQDEVVPVGENILIAGRRDARPIGMKAGRKQAAELLAGIDGSRTIIMLDHQPGKFKQTEEAGVNLLLCGHTHRGQLFPANLATRIMFKKAGAVHYGRWQGETMQAVVTSGAGFWGPPIRVGTNNEAVVIDITFTSP